MMPRADIDVREFNRAIQQLSKGVKEKAVHLSNQIALDVASEWFDALPPPINQIQAKRSEIRRYLHQVLAVRIKLAKSGKRFLKSGKMKNQLQRRHLIIQARNRRAGKRGLYGKTMKKAAGAFAQRAQVSVGYLKVILLPVIRSLNQVMRMAQAQGIRAYVKRFSETAGAISIWPGSKGYGKVMPAAGSNPLAILNLQWSFHGPREGYARSLVMAGWRQAADFKLGKLRRRIERELHPELNKVNVAKTGL